MERVIISRKDGVQIDLSGIISVVDYDAESHTCKVCAWGLSELKSKSHDVDNNPVRWQDYNYSTIPREALFGDVVRVLCV